MLNGGEQKIFHFQSLALMKSPTNTYDTSINPLLYNDIRYKFITHDKMCRMDIYTFI